MNIQDHISGSLEAIFWGQILKFFDAEPDPKSEIFLTLDPGWEKFGSGINIPDPHHGFKRKDGSMRPRCFDTQQQQKITFKNLGGVWILEPPLQHLQELCHERALMVFTNFGFLYVVKIENKVFASMKTLTNSKHIF
jgi:hypothetical protein